MNLLGEKVSNIERYIDLALDYSTKLFTVWDLSDYQEKQELQFLVFPDGMSYNRKMDQCRTTRINEVFRCIADQQRVLTNANTQTIDLTLEIPIGTAG